MKKTTRTIELTIEKKEFLHVNAQRKSVLAWCADCGRRVAIVTPEEAARAVGVSARTIYCRVEAGTVHFIETPAGALLVCLESLLNQAEE